MPRAIATCRHAWLGDDVALMYVTPGVVFRPIKNKNALKSFLKVPSFL